MNTGISTRCGSETNRIDSGLGEFRKTNLYLCSSCGTISLHEWFEMEIKLTLHRLLITNTGLAEAIEKCVPSPIFFLHAFRSGIGTLSQVINRIEDVQGTFTDIS